MALEQDELTLRLNAETATIAWSELQRQFAQGRTLYVAPELDLVAVAKAIIEDHSAYMEPLVAKESVRAVLDDEAQTWLAEDKAVWAVVVPPYVLVQPTQEATD